MKQKLKGVLSLLAICVGGLVAGLASTMAHAAIIDDEMVSVPAGSFQMGCNLDYDPICYYAPDEKQHKVNLDAFEIDKYEVTFRRYQKCVDAGKCTPPAVGGALNYGWPGVELYPVNGVTWYQAKAFCEYEKKRLPTEAEWEKAARGTDQRTYPWGWEEPDCKRAVVDSPNAGALGCKTGNTMNVGSKPEGQSPYGAMDMAGNLWEWTADWHSESYYNQSPERNPKGPEQGHYKTARGGDFFSRQGYEVRTTSRFPYYPSNYSIAIGFRCAR
ncbi:formylglycine-generating enzyme family protein [Endozoicomonadaceae bacterium StTr2]